MGEKGIVSATLFDQRRASAVFSSCPRCFAACGPDGICSGTDGWACVASAHYRYVLRVPTGIEDDRVCTFCLANPSTATAENVPKSLDPTVRRCFNWAQSWGYGWCWIVNVRAWRQTHPKRVPSDAIAIGPDNDYWLRDAFARAALVVVGWGRLAGEERERHVKRLLRESRTPVHALRLLPDGTPSHPLARGKNALPRELQPVPMVIA